MTEDSDTIRAVTIDSSAGDGPSAGRRGGHARLITLLGPAFIAAVAYVDPGNVAANLQAGARYGYLLLWVLVVATGAAGIVQYLSAKLGIVTGATLPELVARRLTHRSRIAYWLQAELVAMATDVAEVVGGAVALQLLFDLPLLLGGTIAAAASLLMLAVQNRRGQRTFEQVVMGFLLAIAIGFVAGLFVVPPDPAGMTAGLLPRFAGQDSLYLAAAMFGATVMPHVVYLHSAIVRDRFGELQPGPRRRRILAATRVDVTASMVLAGGVNIAMLLLAASALPGKEGVDTLEGAHAAIAADIGPVIGVFFAVGLLLSSLASTSVGAYAGSVIMHGLIHRDVPLLVRRSVTVIPALIALALFPEPTSLLVVSQVVLSFGLPFALVPLVRFTSDAALLGPARNSVAMRWVAWTVATSVVVLNLMLLAELLW